MHSNATDCLDSPPSIRASVPLLNKNNNMAATIVTSIAPSMVSTAFDLPGYRVVRTIGVIRSVVVRSLNFCGLVASGLRACCGGRNARFETLCEKTRAEAHDEMVRRARELGANAVIGMRYDTSPVMDGITEVLAYGTAVVVEPI